MSNSNSSTTGGVSTLGLLAVVLITLKLLGSLKISWLWATAPLWMPMAVICVIVAFCLVIYVLGVLVD